MFLQKKILLMVIFMSLTGCEMMNSSYDCPLSNGASCISLGEMDEAVTRGIYPKPKGGYTKSYNKFHVSHKDLIPGTYPMRTKDLIAKIWIAPYQDGSGNYHEQSNIYTVIEKSDWVGAPIIAPKLKG